MSETLVVSDVQAERNFIDTITERFEAEDAKAATPEPEIAAPTPAPKVEKPSTPEPAGDVTPAPDVTPPPEEPVSDDEPDQGNEPPEETEEQTDEEFDEEFAAAAKLNKVALTVEDLPADARPLVSKRIKELEAGFTKAMQDARSYRADEAKFRAEQSFQKENPAEFVVDLLLKHPQLGEQVNALIDGMTTQTQRQAHDIVVADKRNKAFQATERELKAADERSQRGLALDSYTRTQALKHGVPMELGVETAVIAHIHQNGDITEKDIDQIVAQKAKEYENHTRAIRREASKKYVASKLDAKKNGGPAIKPGSGNAPAPAGKAKPKNDAEFAADFIARLK